MKRVIHAILRSSPQSVFLFLGVSFGLLFLLLTPPFQTPDEVNHFYKAYQISEGKFVSSKVDNRVGGYLPYEVAHVADSFLLMPGRMHEKTSAKSIFDQFKKKSSKKEFVDFANTAVYSPISYLPQSIGIFLARSCGASPLFLMYVGRLFSLFFWLTCVFLAIRNIPVFKWLLVLLALLPMSVTVNASLSADVMSNALAFLVIAHALKLARTEEEWTRNHWIYALCLGVLLASAKLVYVPIFLLYLLVPIKKFSSRKSYFIQIGVLAGITLLTVLVWSKIMAGSHLTYAEYNSAFRELSNLSFCADIHAQTKYIFGHWGYLVESIGNGFVLPFEMYTRGYVGTFGWIDTYLPTWSVILTYLVIFFVAITDYSDKNRFKLKHRLVLLSAPFLMFSLVVVSQLLIWTCVGDSVVTNLQGRYFIPVFPLVFMAIGGKWKVSWIPALVVVFSTFMLVFSLNVIYKRYYVPSQFSNVSLTFNADEIVKKGGFSTTQNHVFSAPPGFMSSIHKVSGKNRFVVSKDSPFGAAVEIRNCQLGDRILVDVKRLGSSGGIVISNQNGTNYRFEQGEESAMDDDWVQLRVSLLITEPKCSGTYSVYLFQPDGDSTAFDNVKIVHRQFAR